MEGLPNFDALASEPADAEDGEAASAIGRAIVWLIKNPNVVRDFLLTLREVGILPNPATPKPTAAPKRGTTYDERRAAAIEALRREAEELEIPLEFLIDDDMDGLETDDYLRDQHELPKASRDPPAPSASMKDIIKMASEFVNEAEPVPPPVKPPAAKTIISPPPPPAVVSDFDLRYEEFKNECLTAAEGASVAQSDVFREFKNFCNERSIDAASSYTMRLRLEALGLKFEKRRGRNYLVGFSLKKKNDGEPTLADPHPRVGHGLSKIELGFLVYLLRYFSPSELERMVASGRSVVLANKRAVCAAVNAIKQRCGLDGIRSVTQDLLRKIMQKIDPDKYAAICAVSGGWEFIESEWSHILKFCDEEEGRPAGPGSRLVQAMLMKLIRN